MAVYGVSFYGTATYGVAPFVEFDASPFDAQPVGYGALRLLWNSPSGTWDRLRLVRNSYGAPDYEDDGTILVNVEGASVSSYLDQDLSEGNFYYYSLFVRDTSVGLWRRAGTTVGLVTRDFAYGKKMHTWLPEWFQIQDEDRARPPHTDGPLRRYLDVIGIAADFSRTELETIRWLRRPEQLSGNLLPLLANMFGVPEEPAIGMRRTRFWVRDAVFLYRSKGTLPGIQGVVTTITGWDCEVSYGPNILKGMDTAAWFLDTGVVLTDDIAQSTFETGDLVLDASHPTAGWVISSAPLDAADIRYHGVPVTAQELYVAEVEARTAAGAANVTAHIDWYDSSETFLSTSSSSLIAADDLSWTKAYIEVSAPSSAAYAVLRIEGDADAFLRRARLQVGAAESWAPPKMLDIALLPTRSNFCTNPAFQYGLQTWSIDEGSITRSTADAYTGDASLLVDAATGTSIVSSTPYAIDAPNVKHTASVWTRDPAVRIRIQWVNNVGAVLATSAWRTAQGDGGWYRASVSSFPVTDAVAGVIEFEVTENSVLDAVLFEDADSAGVYFDGSFAGADYLWSGASHQSASRFYPARAVRNNRLTELLPDYLPVGQIFELRYVADVTSAPRFASDEAVGIGQLGIIQTGA